MVAPGIKFGVVTVPSSWPGGPLVFFIQGQTGAATYNYPFTFST